MATGADSTGIIREILIALPATIAAVTALVKVILEGNAQRKEITTLKGQVKELQTAYAKEVKENQDLHGQIAALAGALSDRDNEVEKLQANFDFLAAEYKRQSDRNETFAAQYAELKANYDLLTRQYDELCRENESLKKELTRLKKQTGGLKE